MTQIVYRIKRFLPSLLIYLTLSLLWMCLEFVTAQPTSFGHVTDLTGTRFQRRVTSQTASIYLPVLLHKPTSFSCDQVVMQVEPAQPTYVSGSPVTITVFGIDIDQHSVDLRWSNRSFDTGDSSSSWIILESGWNPSQARIESSWVISDSLPGIYPFDRSEYQEYIIDAAVRSASDGKLLCSIYTMPACQSCRVLITSRAKNDDSQIQLDDFWKIVPGHSITYLGDRLDFPEDDSGAAVASNFVTRMEYESPVQFCNNLTLIPQRWSKNNRWGYWNPALPKRSERTGSIWSDGNTTLRFLLTAPSFAYQWQDAYVGAYAHKVYEVTNKAYVLGEMGSKFNRTIIHSNQSGEHHYYPPYLLALESIPTQGYTEFARIDSLYHFIGEEQTHRLCQPRSPNMNHRWYTRARLLKDQALRNEFATITQYFTTTHEIAVLTYIEGGDFSAGKPAFREDWYLMRDVGLVGVDQVRWDASDVTIARTYIQAEILRHDLPTAPTIRVRAHRAYVGKSLTISAIWPDSSFPMTVAAGSCYTIALNSAASLSMPYDGQLEQDRSVPPARWINAISGNPHWAEAGRVTECLPLNFPSGEYKVRLRPHIIRSNGAHEVVQQVTEMPWSTNELWIIVP